jgi:hypothetical protein
VQRLLKASGLPLEKSLPNFDVKRLPVKALRQLRALLEGGFLDRKENGLVFGPGSGKSHLLTALARADRSAGTQDAFHQVRTADARSLGCQAGLTAARVHGL